MSDADTTKRLGSSFVGGFRIDLRCLVLKVLEGPDKDMVVRVTHDLVRIGKSRDSDLVLTDPAVSRNHAEIRVTEGGLALRDVGSTNGTFVKEMRVTEVVLERSFHCRVGDTVLAVEVRNDPRLALEGDEESLGGMFGKSPPMRRLFGVLRAVATAPVTVLVQGESGTGKELVARTVHELSKRPGPLVVFDAATTDANLVGSHLFGHVKGAFTGADAPREGAFRRAHTGTLFIDELGELPLDLQPRLLRALENREVTPIGSDVPERVDVRVVAATHRDLPTMVARGEFREDLLHRLSVVRVEVPPLRDRLEDVPALIEGLRKRQAIDLELSREAHEALCLHHWPGNVRALRNQLERLAALCRGRCVTVEDLDLPQAPPELVAVSAVDPEKVRILAALKRNRGNKARTARELEMSLSTLKRRVSEYEAEDL